MKLPKGDAAAQRGLLIYGCGGHAKVVADAAQTDRWNVLGFADDDPERADTFVLGLPVVVTGRDDAVTYCLENRASVIIAVGDNRARQEIFQHFVEHSVHVASVVHQTAAVANSARISQGTVILAQAVVGPESRIGENVIINTAAAVDHDCDIGDHAHLAPGARTGGTARVGEGTMLGIGACARNGVTIGAWSMIGMGAVVVSDLGDEITALGVPARVRS